ncbi:hypothetical protein SPFL3102_01491 [Sporomusaceae bacterium FL31]|nr:hypothetical protein SPFL3101_03124 [Sporomusaceae bacterium FL31]GCE33683.1 hypothetical protein SPFL3102_01491 [Sporomusaceae bacterium]
MSLPISAAAILEKNKLTSDGAWLVLLEVNVPDMETLFFVRNTDNIIWPAVGGNQYIAFPFEMDDTSQDSKGEIPGLTVRVSNVTRSVQSYLEAAQGGVGATVTIRVVHSRHLDQVTPEVEEEFSVQDTAADDNWVYFNLGPAYPINARRPERRYMKNFCPYEYGDCECGISSEVYRTFPSCGHTLTDCRIRNNSKRFGGEASIPQGGIYL